MNPGALRAPAPRGATNPAPGPAISERLAEFTAGLSPRDIPDAVALRAKHLLLDAIGCGFAARGEPFATRIAASVARLAGDGPRGVLGLAQRLPLRDAAVVNGMLMHGLDYDDTHPAAITHLTVSTFPAALATAAHTDASGSELLVAYIAGVETGARIASVAKGGFHRAGFHPTGVVGAFASSLVAGRIMKLSRPRLVTAQGIALSLASGSLQFLADGSWTKRIHPGWAAACGITAASLAADDIAAPTEAYEGRFGLYRSHLPPDALADCDFALATAGLGSVWEVDNVAVKPFPACHLVHACAEAAIALHWAGVDPERVRSVRALVPGDAVSVVCEPAAAKRRPKSEYEAKFSLHYAIASGLARGRLGLAELLPGALVEPRIEQLMDKVDYAIDASFEFPKYYGGEVQIALDDGRTLNRRVDVNRGNPDRSLSNAEIEAKYFENCAMTLARDPARRIRDLVLELDSVANATRLETALASSGESAA
jgi:2-methylcitrate dehydratase PrpD